MPKFVPRQRKHKVLARQKASDHGTSSATSNTDANAAQIIPLSKDEREIRRQKMRDELKAQQPKMSAKKQKRLDKYIENKLKKDENLDLVRKLEAEKDKWDARGLMSSKNLKKRGFDDFVKSQVGTGMSHEVVEVKPDTKKSRQGQDVNEDEDAASEDSFEAEHQEAFNDKSAPVSDEAWMAKRAAPAQGTGLANPLPIGPDGLPIIPIRTSKKRRNKSLDEDVEQTVDQTGGELPWEGFDSEPDEGEWATSEDESEADTESDSTDEGRSIEDSDISEEDFSDEDDSDDENDSDASTSATSQENVKIKPRASAFKAWATQQLNQAVGHTPSYAPDGEGELRERNSQSGLSVSTVARTKEHVTIINGLPEFKNLTNNRMIYSVQVQRTEYIQESRTQLPILQREQEIMEAIHANSVVVVKGDTGSGKTTQLPQFLYEAGYGDPNGPTPGMIGITQPRRVAAVSMAKRVSDELGDHGNRVAHQIRFDSSVSSKTAIKFMTDGILLRELSQDLLLKKYSAIIIDEAHERSVNTDILIGMLSKIVPARMRKDKFNPDPKPLKLIIMSATLNIKDFLHDKLFVPSLQPPIVEAEGRQHRVTTHFALRSRADYLEEVVEKIKRAHRKLPKGGVLVFLTGQSEIKQVQMRLRKELAQSKNHISSSISNTRMHLAASETPLEMDDIDFGTSKIQRLDEEDEVDILTHSDEEAEEREFEISDDEDDEDENQTGVNKSASKQGKRDPYDSVHVLPLYSQLPTKEQLRVFDPAPDRSRMIVLATNVAETSLTIPGIRYVFDCGRSKERKYHRDTGVQSFEIDYISKASAQQRAGRAGRTGPGHCWRLYTSAVYEQYFPEHTEPEILRAPAESVVLQIKGFAYPRPVVEFPFPTAPTLQSLDKAERLLRNLGALDLSGGVTELGKQLSFYPLSPRLGKILATAVTNKAILLQANSLVAGLAVGDVYINGAVALAADDDDEIHETEERDQRKQQYGRAQAILSRHDKTSDAMKVLTTVSMYINAADKDDFCTEYSVKPKAMQEAAQLMQQLGGIISANNPDTISTDSPNSQSTVRSLLKSMEPTSKLPSSQVKQINTTAAAGYIDQIAIRWDCHPNPPALPVQPRRTIDVPYLPLIPLHSTPTSSDITQHLVYIHPTSILSRLPPKSLPQYLTYTHLQQSQPQTINSPSPKTRMFPLTPLDAGSLARLAHGSGLIEYGKPVPKMTVEEIPGTPRRRVCWVSVELRGEKGRVGWPLPAVKVKQVIDVKTATGWRVEEVLS